MSNIFNKMYDYRGHVVIATSYPDTLENPLDTSDWEDSVSIDTAGSVALVVDSLYKIHHPNNNLRLYGAPFQIRQDVHLRRALREASKDV